jgi:hypothetical protein
MTFKLERSNVIYLNLIIIMNYLLTPILAINYCNVVEDGLLFVKLDKLFNENFKCHWFVAVYNIRIVIFI